MEHSQANDQAEVANKIILSGMKRKLDKAKGLWAEYFHEMLWSYYTTPHSTTKETPFYIVYGADAMILVEINSPIWHGINFIIELNHAGLDKIVDLLEEDIAMVQVKDIQAKQRMEHRFNSRVRPRSFHEGNLVLKRITDAKKKGRWPITRKVCTRSRRY